MKLKKAMFVVLGLFFTGLGAVGAFLPILPTTPFLLVAAACFTKGSDRFDRWFKNTKLYKNNLESFVKSRSMTLKTKICLCAFATSMLVIAFFMMNNIFGRATIVAVILVKYWYFIFRIETIKPGEEPTAEKTA